MVCKLANNFLACSWAVRALPIYMPVCQKNLWCSVRHFHYFVCQGTNFANIWDSLKFSSVNSDCQNSRWIRAQCQVGCFPSAARMCHWRSVGEVTGSRGQLPGVHWFLRQHIRHCGTLGVAMRVLQHLWVHIASASKMFKGPEVHLNISNAKLAATVFALCKIRDYLGLACFSLGTNNMSIFTFQS